MKITGITVYELLGLIKEGKAPKKIKVTGTIYYFDEEFNFYFTKTKKGDVALGGKLNEINLLYNFDNECNVEILEEEKKIPEKLEYYDDSIAWVIDDVGQLSDVDKVIIDKLNEVLDYLKSKGE